MKKTLLKLFAFVTLSTISTLATAQVDFTPIFTQIKLEARADFDYYHINTHVSAYGTDNNESQYGFHGRYFNFVIGGPYGDTGLTGRKIIVDTYGGRGAHGGGAFSGKDPSKVDRSAAYAARYIAKNMVAAGVADEVLVQVSYAIGVAKPVSLYVNTYGTAKVKMNDAEIARRIGRLFDLRPAAIIRDLKLTQPMYEETARYGHMGRTNEVVTKSFIDSDGKPFSREVELFTWEKLDRADAIKQAFKL